jgi:hypothetical protein
MSGSVSGSYSRSDALTREASGFGITCRKGALELKGDAGGFEYIGAEGVDSGRAEGHRTVDIMIGVEACRRAIGGLIT